MLYFGFDPPTIIAFVITALLAFAYHELAHALVADRLGDPTPRSYGRISLNPFVHLDLFGTIMLLLIGFGWASTPVSPDRLRGNPRTSMAIVAVAGPVANLLMAIIYAIPILIGLVHFAPSGRIFPSPFSFLYIGIQINVLLMVFNLLPIPPLDGFTILLGLLPAEMAYQLAPLRQSGFIILLVVIFLLPNIGIDVFSAVLNPIMSAIIPFLLGA
ncbi:MAG: site-2 protease family protein [Candidatus Promineifilaceae bacterium]